MSLGGGSLKLCMQGSVQVQELYWGNHGHIERCAAAGLPSQRHSAAASRGARGAAAAAGGGYDLVVGADLLYNAAAFGPLRRTLLRLVRPGGSVLLSFPDRGLGSWADEGYRGDDAASTLGGQFERTLGTEGSALESEFVRAVLRRSAFHTTVCPSAGPPGSLPDRCFVLELEAVAALGTAK